MPSRGTFTLILLTLLAGAGAGCGGGGGETDDLNAGTSTTSIPIDPSDSERTIDLPGEAGPIAIGRKYVWSATDAGLVRIDPDEDAVVGKPAKLRGAFATDITIDSGRVWVATSDAEVENRRLAGFDEKTGKPIGKPIEVAGTGGIDAGGGDLWVVGTGKSLTHRDARTGREIGRVKLSIDPQAVVVEDGGAWARSDSQGVQGVDAKTGKPIGKAQRLDPPLLAMSGGEGAVWIAPDAKTESEPRVVWRIDPQTGRTTEKIKLGGPAPGIAADEGIVWVYTLDNELHKFDPRTGRELGDAHSLDINTPLMAAGHGAVWLGDSNEESLTAVEP
jgi:outer membrane protein assembly factor BamB